jgi:preprotein translocase subunit SecE
MYPEQMISTKIVMIALALATIFVALLDTIH